MADALERAAHGWWAALVMDIANIHGVCPYDFITFLLYFRTTGIVSCAVRKDNI